MGGGGGGTKRKGVEGGGVQVKFDPWKKWGGKSFSHAERRTHKVVR